MKLWQFTAEKDNRRWVSLHLSREKAREAKAEYKAQGIKTGSVRLAKDGDPLSLAMSDGRDYDAIVERYKNAQVNPVETWSMDVTLAALILPRLKACKQHGCCLRDSSLDQMIEGFSLILDNCPMDFASEEVQNKAEEALNLFAEYYFYLWN